MRKGVLNEKESNIAILLLFLVVFPLYIEALCAVPPKAPAHSPSQMPLRYEVTSCAPSQHIASCAKTAMAWRGGRAPPVPPKAKSCEGFYGTPSAAFSATSCAAFFTFTCSCSSFGTHVSPKSKPGTWEAACVYTQKKRAQREREREIAGYRKHPPLYAHTV